MTVELILLDRYAHPDRIRGIWSELCAKCKPSYFLSEGWVDNWLNCVPDQVLIQLATLCENGDATAAFFVGKNDLVRRYAIKSRGLFLNATGIAAYDTLCIEYNSLLCPEPALSTLKTILGLLPEPWDELFLPGLDMEAFPGNSLQQALAPYRVIIDRDEPTPFVDLQEVRQTENGYLSLLSSNTRYQIRRSYRRYEQRGPIQLKLAENLDEAFEVFDILIQLHEKTWQARRKISELGSEFSLRFHKDLIRNRFVKGEIQLLRLKAGNSLIGTLYNFVFQGKVYFYQSGMKYEADQRLKPGLLCHAEAIEYNAQLGHGIYDFLGGAARYKSSLATHRKRLVWARVQKPRCRFLVETKLKAFKGACTAAAKNLSAN